MKYRIVKYFFVPDGVYRYKVQRKILWWWQDFNFGDCDFCGYVDFKDELSAEEYFQRWKHGKEKPSVVKYLQPANNEISN